MLTTLRKVACVLFALVISNGILWAAGTSSVEGTVKDEKGQPIKNADVRIVANAKVVATCKTDAKGHYASQPVGAGVYKVDLLINAKPQASIANVVAKSGGSTQANFDFRQAKAAIKKRVWVVETGSNVGHWVDVDENGNPIGTNMNNVSKSDASYLQRIQDRTAGAMAQPMGR